MEIESTPSSSQDSRLIALAKTGDQSAFSILMKKYRDAIFHTVLKMIYNRDDAEDIVLVTFSKAFNNINAYNEEFAFSTWLFKIASNNCIDFLRKKRIQTTPLYRGSDDSESEQMTAIPVKDKNPDPEESYMKEQRIAKIRQVVDSMNPKYKQLIELRYFDELSYEEIAEKTDLPLGTVKAQLFRAKDILYSNLKDSKDFI